MRTELEYRRFFGLVLVFLGSIFILVFSADLLALFVAWDLLGFSSFFLVVFFRSRSSLSGGFLTCLTNRLGDVLLLAYFGMAACSSSTSCFGPISLLLFISFTKSAQVPFSSWLPAAMLAPTPVSALVHSSTLVTAGVYLLFRFYPVESRFLLFVGLLTTLIAGLAACAESDLKKIIALSTLSQLGLIIMCLGLGERSICFAHLNTHAAFKALLFIAVGTVIHTFYGNQEARASVGLAFASPAVFITASVSIMSMCGCIFLSGWVTKEAILEASYNSSTGLFFACLFYFSISLTLSYSLRLCTLFSMSQRPDNPCSSPVSCYWPHKFPLGFLLVLAIAQGSVLWLNIVIPPTFLSISDKLVVIFVLLGTAYWHDLLSGLVCSVPSM